MHERSLTGPVMAITENDNSTVIEIKIDPGLALDPLIWSGDNTTVFSFERPTAPVNIPLGNPRYDGKCFGSIRLELSDELVVVKFR